MISLVILLDEVELFFTFFLLKPLISGAIFSWWDQEYRKKIKLKSGIFCFKLSLLIKDEWK